jgi:hypothetical protein
MRKMTPAVCALSARHVQYVCTVCSDAEWFCNFLSVSHISETQIFETSPREYGPANCRAVYFRKEPDVSEETQFYM